MFDVWVMKFGGSNNAREFNTIEQLEKLQIMDFEQRAALTGDLYIDVTLLQR